MFRKKQFADPSKIIINKSTKLSHLPNANQEQIALLIDIVKLMKTKYLLDVTIRIDKTTLNEFSFIFLNRAHGMEDDKIDEQNQIGVRLLLKFDAILTKESDGNLCWSNTILTVNSLVLNDICKQLKSATALDPDYQQPRIMAMRTG